MSIYPYEGGLGAKVILFVTILKFTFTIQRWSAVSNLSLQTYVRNLNFIYQEFRQNQN